MKVFDTDLNELVSFPVSAFYGLSLNENHAIVPTLSGAELIDFTNLQSIHSIGTLSGVESSNTIVVGTNLYNSIGDDVEIYDFTNPIVNNELPILKITMSTTAPLVNSQISFASNAIDPDGDTLTFSWNFGDGTTSSLENPQHAYVKEGVYNISCTATDQKGSTTTDIMSFVVNTSLDSNVSNGWTLMGTSASIKDLSFFNNFKIIWAYENNIWKAYSGTARINDELDALKIEKINSISKNRGFWIYKD